MFLLIYHWNRRGEKAAVAAHEHAYPICVDDVAMNPQARPLIRQLQFSDVPALG